MLTPKFFHKCCHVLGKKFTGRRPSLMRSLKKSHSVLASSTLIVISECCSEKGSRSQVGLFKAPTDCGTWKKTACLGCGAKTLGLTSTSLPKLLHDCWAFEWQGSCQVYLDLLALLITRKVRATASRPDVSSKFWLRSDWWANLVFEWLYMLFLLKVRRSWLNLSHLIYKFK